LLGCRVALATACLLALSPVALAQAPSAAPPVAARSAAAPGPAATGAAPTGTAPAMPPGHPPTTASPHGASPHGAAPQDQILNDPALPPGVIEAQIVDAQETPVPNLEVRLGIMFQKISEGESRSQKTLKSSASGIARFEGLATTSEYSYRVTIKNGAAEYASAPFNLNERMGQRVILHSYPVTSDPESIVLGMRGTVYVEPRDDIFQFEVFFKVFNMGTAAWVPSDAIMRLPEGFKAFSATESMFDAGFVAEEGRGARLKGTFPPGQRDVSFRFQTPKSTDSTASFTIGLPPRVADLQVIALSNPQMTMSVEGFEPAQEVTGKNGDHALLTRKVLRRGERAPSQITATLGGLPVPGPGRWVASGLAALIAVLGLGIASGKLPISADERAKSDRARARELLFDELVELEATRRRGEIGPRAYEQAKALLVAAVARLGLPAEKKKRSKPKRATA
jgi:hypothetical protein